MEQILKELKEQCVLEDNEEDFLSIIDTIKDFVMSTEKNKDENSGGDSLAVSPRDVLKPPLWAIIVLIHHEVKPPKNHLLSSRPYFFLLTSRSLLWCQL
jgi:hypothetical protein